ncbi:MAG: hypothetical protein GY866_00660 [Proteobacteria bacterium]|nr:hypothetical protein [Pseudomonadota bacterium]
MDQKNSNPRIFLAFRFHANFYHSYRGDTPDELGFGKDIRIIRHIIQVLDTYNRRGVDVCGTWDYENYFSLEKIMPVHCPDIIESLKRRVDQGRDEIQLMSYNNALLSSHSAKEFEDAVVWSIANTAGSGVRDIFGTFGSMVRPQEMMYTPIHLKLYPHYGVESISLFYSALPFNAFSNFMPPLSTEERYNPLRLTYPGIEESMTLVPAYNVGDLADNISLGKWVKRLRQEQLEMAEPKDLLLLLDMDADDEFWVGVDIPVLKKFYTTLKGLSGLLESVRDLDYVSYTTPCRYLEEHPPLGSVVIGQDTADGNFDGLSSWAEKWSSQQLWTGLERSRVLELQTLRLLEMAENGSVPKTVAPLMASSYENRLKSFSTTHFGLSSPVLNLSRLKIANKLVGSVVADAADAFNLLKDAVGKEGETEDNFALIDYTRGISTAAASFQPQPSQGLARLPLQSLEAKTESVNLLDATGNVVPCAFRLKKEKPEGELLWVENMKPNERKDYHLEFDSAEKVPTRVDKPVVMTETSMRNESISLQFDANHHLTGLAFAGREMARDRFLDSTVTYADRKCGVPLWTVSESQILAQGMIGITKMRAEIVIKADGEKRVFLERELMLAAGLPYLYVNMTVHYPQTPLRKYIKKRAKLLEQKWDGYWHEVLPCEIAPALFGRQGRHLRVWKHNFCGHMSFYDLNYADFSKNEELDSFNNHITNGWVAVSDGDRGLLVAQTADALSSFAFCPMRTRKLEQGTGIFLNPFGSYNGRQLNYGTAYTGLGKLAALATSDHLEPCAASFNGSKQEFSLLVAPYAGNEPPEEIRNDAAAFSYPYLLLSHSDAIAEPEHRQWHSAF